MSLAELMPHTFLGSMKFANVLMSLAKLHSFLAVDFVGEMSQYSIFYCSNCLFTDFMFILILARLSPCQVSCLA